MHSYLYFHVFLTNITSPLAWEIKKVLFDAIQMSLGTLVCHCGTVECPPGIRGCSDQNTGFLFSMLIPFPFLNVPLSPPGPITGSEAGLGDEEGRLDTLASSPMGTDGVS